MKKKMGKIPYNTGIDSCSEKSLLNEDMRFGNIVQYTVIHLVDLSRVFEVHKAMTDHELL